MNEQEKLELLEYLVQAAREALGVYEETSNEDAKITSLAELRGLLHQIAGKIANWRAQ